MPAKNASGYPTLLVPYLPTGFREVPSEVLGKATAVQASVVTYSLSLDEVLNIFAGHIHC